MKIIIVIMVVNIIITNTTNNNSNNKNGKIILIKIIMKIIMMIITTLYIINDTYNIHSYYSKIMQAYKNHVHLPAPISILPISSRPRPPSRCSWDCPRHPVLPWPPPSPSRPHVPQHCWRLGLPWRSKAAWTGSTCHTPPGKKENLRKHPPCGLQISGSNLCDFQRFSLVWDAQSKWVKVKWHTSAPIIWFSWCKIIFGGAKQM